VRAIEEAGLPALLLSGHSGIGSGLPGVGDPALRDEVRALILKQNAARLLGLARPS
jgi:hypothetical protein